MEALILKELRLKYQCERNQLHECIEGREESNHSEKWLKAQYSKLCNVIDDLDTAIKSLPNELKGVTNNEQNKNFCDESCHHFGYSCNINELYKECQAKRKTTKKRDTSTSPYDLNNAPGFRKHKKK